MKHIKLYTMILLLSVAGSGKGSEEELAEVFEEGMKEIPQEEKTIQKSPSQVRVQAVAALQDITDTVAKSAESVDGQLTKVAGSLSSTISKLEARLKELEVFSQGAIVDQLRKNTVEMIQSYDQIITLEQKYTQYYKIFDRANTEFEKLTQLQTKTPQSFDLIHQNFLELEELDKLRKNAQKDTATTRSSIEQLYSEIEQIAAQNKRLEQELPEAVGAAKEKVPLESEEMAIALPLTVGELQAHVNLLTRESLLLGNKIASYEAKSSAAQRISEKSEASDVDKAYQNQLERVIRVAQAYQTKINGYEDFFQKIIRANGGKASLQQIEVDEIKDALAKQSASFKQSADVLAQEEKKLSDLANASVKTVSASAKSSLEEPFVIISEEPIEASERAATFQQLATIAEASDATIATILSAVKAEGKTVENTLAVIEKKKNVLTNLKRRLSTTEDEIYTQLKTAGRVADAYNKALQKVDRLLITLEFNKANVMKPIQISAKKIIQESIAYLEQDIVLERKNLLSLQQAYEKQQKVLQKLPAPSL